ncbi:MAG: thioredoxin family protein [Bacteroidia bacterium]
MNKVLYFRSPGCGVCVDLKPKVKQLINTRFSKLEFELVDISTTPEIASKHTVFTAPTVLVFFDGKETLRFARHMSIGEIEEKVGRLYELYFG